MIFGALKKVGLYSETDKLETVILGIAKDWGDTPDAEDCYDPRSLESVLNNVYPGISEVDKELEIFRSVLEKHGVQVLRPKLIENLNQVFARDISFVIDDKFIIPHIIPDRQKELEGIFSIIDGLDADHIIRLPKGAHAEGGDVLLWHNYLFIGCSNDKEFEKYKVARTNVSGVNALKEHFPEKTIRTFELNKSDTDPFKNTLHLDCCFQPIGKNKCILYPGGLKNEDDIKWIKTIFGDKNVFEVTEEEAYHLFPNVFSIDQKTIVSNEAFDRLNSQLVEWGFEVEEIPYGNVAKMGGLLRCTTQPLSRKMSKQTTFNVMMIRPAGFRMNEQTAVNNYYQQNDSSADEQEIKAKAIEEFYAFVKKLESDGVNVIVVQDNEEPSTPDALFPNNWVSFHEDGRVGLYPMFAENRRQERRQDILDKLVELGYGQKDIVDFTLFENENKFLEGTGSLVLDRQNRIAYAAISQRTHTDLVDEFCDVFGYRAVKFYAMQTVEGIRVPIYHTNVMMCIGSKIAMICLDCIDDPKEREYLKNTILESGKELLELSEEQINQFAGNMLQLLSKDGKDLIVMSSQAYKSLNSAQISTIEKYGKIVESPLNLIEKLGGGSARCMIAENFLPQ